MSNIFKGVSSVLTSADGYGIPVKVLPDIGICNHCAAYQMDNGESLDDLDCEKCNNKQFRYGYLKDIKRQFLTNYGVIIFENGEIAMIPLGRVVVINVPKIEKETK